MQRSDFNYELPPELIAQKPLENRTASRLLVMDGGLRSYEDRLFTDIVDYLKPGDVLVFNDTRVIPARMHGQKQTGGKVEVLVERVVSEDTVYAHVRASKAPKAGSRLTLEGEVEVLMKGRVGELFELEFQTGRSVFEVLEEYGHIPLPPYIQRPDDSDDHARYQTVYANKPGAVAAPTAGLHFDGRLLNIIRSKGIETVFVTLHVGAGTFLPVRADNLEDHVMHGEYVDVSEEACKKIREARKKGGRVVAVGTTSVRSLESASQSGKLIPYAGETKLFITPGYKFKTVDVLITNFHLPESTLMMLVSAFGGYEHTMATYKHAVDEKYRFFSYGDAMLIFPQKGARALDDNE